MTHFDLLMGFGLLSAFLSLLAFLVYIASLLVGQTQPLRATWLIWSVLSALSLMSNLDKGASFSAAFITVQAGATFAIFLLSVPLGSGGYLNRKDGAALLAAACGLILWALTDDAIYALAISLSVSAIGGVATVVKAYHAPQTESRLCWGLLALAAAFASVSVGAFDPVLLAYPVYLLILYSAVLLAIGLGRRAAVQPRQTAYAPARATPALTSIQPSPALLHMPKND